MQSLHLLLIPGEGLWPPERAIPKVLGKLARRISACFTLSRSGRPALSRIKAPPPIIACETIRSRAGQLALSMPGHGASNGHFRSLARLACHHPCLRHGLVGAGRRSFGWYADHARRIGADPEIRRAFRVFCFTAVLGGVEGQMAGGRAQA